MRYADLVTELTARLAITITQLKLEGTTGMSRANLLMMTSFRGLHFANDNTMHRAFTDALAQASKIHRSFTVTE